MPQVPERQPSHDELFDASIVRKYRRTNRNNHVMQRRSARRKQKKQEAYKASQHEFAYQQRLGKQLRSMFMV